MTGFVTVTLHGDTDAKSNCARRSVVDNYFCSAADAQKVATSAFKSLLNAAETHVQHSFCSSALDLKPRAHVLKHAIDACIDFLNFVIPILVKQKQLVKQKLLNRISRLSIASTLSLKT